VSLEHVYVEPQCLCPVSLEHVYVEPRCLCPVPAEDVRNGREGPLTPEDGDAANLRNVGTVLGILQDGGSLYKTL
jgi:hypothetical protein